MFKNKKAKLATTLFFMTTLAIPFLSLLIMNYQTEQANLMTAASVVENTGDTHLFAGILIIVLTIAGLTSLFFKVQTHIKTKIVEKKATMETVNSEIDNLTEELKRL